MRSYTMTVLLLAVFVLALGATVVLAADGTEMPWDDLEITIGGVVLLWAGIVAGLIEIGKHIRIGGTPLLGTPGKIWAANLILGGIGVFVYELSRGTDVIPALLAAGAAVLAASGIFEGVKTAVGKSPVPSNHGGTG